MEIVIVIVVEFVIVGIKIVEVNSLPSSALVMPASQALLGKGRSRSRASDADTTKPSLVEKIVYDAVVLDK
jgi:hypothetical protein